MISCLLGRPLRPGLALLDIAHGPEAAVSSHEEFARTVERQVLFARTVRTTCAHELFARTVGRH